MQMSAAAGRDDSKAIPRGDGLHVYEHIYR